MTNININNIPPEPPHCITEPKLVVLTRSFSECSEICQACIFPHCGWGSGGMEYLITTITPESIPVLTSGLYPCCVLVSRASLIILGRIYLPGTINSQAH